MEHTVVNDRLPGFGRVNALADANTAVDAIVKAVTDLFYAQFFKRQESLRTLEAKGRTVQLQMIRCTQVAPARPLPCLTVGEAQGASRK